MSFHFEFTAASAEAACKIIDQETAPECVKTFLKQAVSMPGPGIDGVRVLAQGHLYEKGNYDVRNCKLEVIPVRMRQPKAD